MNQGASLNFDKKNLLSDVSDVSCINNMVDDLESESDSDIDINKLLNENKNENKISEI